MNGTTRLAYSQLSRILTSHQFTVADLCKRLNKRGIPFDRKTVYRLAGFKPIQTINAPILRAVCEELNVGIGDIIAWEPSKPVLHHIDEKTQERLSFLMDKNNEGRLSGAEAKELAELGDYAEKLSLENARILAEAAAAAKRFNPEAKRRTPVAPIPAVRKSRKKVPA
ncbi:MAG: helix-turn-helix transcriptional regulator [Chthoniobacteraceae bacterium]|jgi:DNA-binding Xre family transcriptional regulator